MNDTILKTLKAELAKKQRKAEKLNTLMFQKHLDKEIAQKMDQFAARFNKSKSAEEKIKISNDWADTSDKWRTCLENDQYQSENFYIWLKELQIIEDEIYDLTKAVQEIEFRNSITQRR